VNQHGATDAMHFELMQLQGPHLQTAPRFSDSPHATLLASSLG